MENTMENEIGEIDVNDISNALIVEYSAMRHFITPYNLDQVDEYYVIDDILYVRKTKDSKMETFSGSDLEISETPDRYDAYNSRNIDDIKLNVKEWIEEDGVIQMTEEARNK